MDAACRRAGRDPSSVTLLAVSKGQPIEAIEAAARAGQRFFAENYAQELERKVAALRGDVRWHFVGGLQRNKVSKIVGLAVMIQTLDREPLAAEIDRRAAAAGIVQEVLVQVNIGSEAQKSGVTPDALGDLVARVNALPRVRCRGLMAIPPLDDEPRPHFRALRDLAASHGLGELSMGMSSDFEAAIEEGATMVRVGTAIFGPRNYR